MEQSYSAQTPPANGMAVTSLILGIISWLLFLLLLCLNLVVLPLLTVATWGAGSVLYVCTAIAGCLSPLGWLIGAILGYMAKNQIQQAGYSNTGLANGAFITNVIGLVITFLGICLLAALMLFGGGAGFLDQMY